MTDGDARQPTLRIVHGGEPTPEELAALVVALAARATAPASAPVRSAWVDRAAGLRRPLPRGAGAWRAVTRSPGVRTRAGA